MRTDVKVNGHTVLAVVLNDIQESLRHRVATIRQAIIREGDGETFIAKDFLCKEDVVSKSVVRNRNSVRRKCDVIYMYKLDEDVQDQLLNGKYF